MPGDTITKDECTERRKQIRADIEDQLAEDRDFLDALFGWGPTVDDIIKEICCKDEKNGCDCQELLQWYKDQGAVIAGLEAYLKAGDFSKNWKKPTTVTAATAGPLGQRPKVSCCLKKVIDRMEEVLTPLGEGLMPTATGWAAIYVGKIFVKAMISGDKSEYYKATAEVELGRSRALRRAIFDLYALCCCEER